MYVSGPIITSMTTHTVVLCIHMYIYIVYNIYAHIRMYIDGYISMYI